MKHFVFCLLAAIIPAMGQILPDTLWIPVTFYDFHSGGNFEIGSGRAVGMVLDTLDADRKPILNTNFPRKDFQVNGMTFNKLNDWYRPWGGETKEAPLTAYKARFGEFVSFYFDSSDRKANVVIYDSIPFTKDINPGQYVYNNKTFFPLNGRGFGNEVTMYPDRNFSFTMEMHQEIFYTKGLILTFGGDDDLWVFINGHKVVDLGGVSSAMYSTFDLDSVNKKYDLKMEEGTSYSLDVFYAERRSASSVLFLNTNIRVPSFRRSMSVNKHSVGITLNGSSSLKYYDIAGRALRVQKPQGVCLQVLNNRVVKLNSIR